MSYTISLCERSVKRGQFLDIRVLGKPLSHPFLVFKDFKDKVISEIHGSWSPSFCKKQVAFSRFLELFIAGGAVINQDQRIHDMFNALNTKYEPVNTMYVYSGLHQYEDAEYEELLKTGSSDEMSLHWQEATMWAKFMNDLRLPYTRYAHNLGLNCQKTLKIVLNESALLPKEDYQLRLGSSGWSRNDSIVLSSPLKKFTRSLENRV